MKKFLASAILVFAASQSYAVCPAAPVASPSELVLQLKKQGDGTAAWAPTTQVSSTVEGSMVWDDANDAIAYCDGTNWVTLSGGSGPAGLNDLTDAKADTTSVFVGSSAGADDDGTDNENTAIGISSLSNNTSGYSNTATGYQALLSNTVGRSNTAIGGETLKANTSGIRNTATGWSALSANTTGSENTANGFRALFRNTTGANNTAIGFTALYENSTGSNNTATGFQAGHFLTDGSSPNATGTNSVFLGASTRALADGQTNQVVIGYNATGAGNNSIVLGNDDIVLTALKGDVGVGNTSPSSTLHVSGDIQIGNDGATCIAQRAGAIRFNGGSIEYCNGSGWSALGAGATNLDELTDATNDTTKSNLFIGHDGGSFGGQNEDNAAVGHGALASLSGTGTNPSGERNAALGTNALQSLTEGVGNTAIGAGSLSSDTNGNYNTAVGAYALRDNTPGDNNGSSTAVGAFSMQLTTTGRNNTAVGHNSLGQNLTGSTNVAIGHNAGYWTSAGNPLTSVNSSVFVGLDTRSLNDNSTNEIVIGRGARGAGNNSVTIGNDTIQKTILKGDIGIGNTSPSTTLHVDVAGADTDGLWLRQTSGYPASGMALLTLDSVYTGVRDLVDFRSGDISRLQVKSNGLIAMGSSGTVVVEPEGNLGIGTANPESLLHINHSTGVTDYDVVPYPVRIKNSAWSNNQLTGIEFWNGISKSVPTSRIISQMAGNGAAGERLIFQTQSADATNPNPKNPTTKMVINPDGGVAIGEGAASTYSGTVAIGYNTTASGYRSVALGTGTSATDHYAFASGEGSLASGRWSSALGSSTASAWYSFSTGTSTASGQGSNALGLFSIASGQNSLAAGYASLAAGNHAMALGHYAKAETFEEVSVGAFPIPNNGTQPDSATTWHSDDIIFEIGNGKASGNSSNAVTVLKSGKIGVGNTSPTSVFHVTGDIQVGNESASCTAIKAGSIRYNTGSLELCDGTTWSALGTGGADNLGDHTATQNVQLGSNYLSGDGDNEGLSISNDGTATISSSAGIPVRIKVIADDSYSIIEPHTYSDSAAANFVAYKSRGTKLSPSFTLSGDSMGTFQARSLNVTGVSTGTGMLIKATENHNATNMGSEIRFRTVPNGAGNAVERVNITHDGKVGIGTDAPSDTLHVAGTALADGWNVPSDRRLKSEIAPIENALDSIEKLVGASFTYKKGGRQSIGLIAQDVEVVFPTAVKTNRYTDTKSVDYNQLIAPLVEAVKELSMKNRALETRIKILEAAE